MKFMYKYSAAVLLLCTIVLASSASAAWTQQVGGVASGSQNGGTIGLATGNAQYGPDSLMAGGASYDHALTEFVNVKADVASGYTGTASASWDTVSPQSFNQPFQGVFGQGYVSTSLNGVISVNVAKTSTYGTAHADATMSAGSGADPNGIGGVADLYANLALTGTGSALAAVTGATAKADAEYTPNHAKTNYGTAQAAGDIKLTALNADDNTLAKLGGMATGSAHIGAETHATNMGEAHSCAIEFMELHASRGESFTGKSYADGYLNGQEMAESVWNLPQVVIPGTPALPIGWSRIVKGIVETSARARNDNPDGNGWVWHNAIVPAVQPVIAQNAHTVTTDLESTSQINGMVLALNIRDKAVMTAYLIPWADVEMDNAFAGVDMYDYAQVVRDTPYAGNVKAQAEGYMPVATWTATASISDYKIGEGENRLAFVSGKQGLSWDGAPAVNAGFGVGAWILNSYNRPQTAFVEATQFTSTEGKGTAKATYELNLNGMKTITGTSDDAVGAFGGVANQVIFVKNAELKPKGYFPTIKDVNAINWLEGSDANPLPGAGKYSPPDMVINFNPTNAIQRTSILSYDQG